MHSFIQFTFSTKKKCPHPKQEKNVTTYLEERIVWQADSPDASWRLIHRNLWEENGWIPWFNVWGNLVAQSNDSPQCLQCQLYIVPFFRLQTWFYQTTKEKLNGEQWNNDTDDMT